MPSDETPTEPVGDDEPKEDAAEASTEEKPDAEHLQAALDSYSDAEQRELYTLLQEKFDPAKSDKKYTLATITDFEK